MKRRLTKKQCIALSFIASNEGQMLPAGDRLPKVVSELESMGLIKCGGKIVDNFEGPSSEFNKACWYLTETGRRPQRTS